MYSKITKVVTQNRWQLWTQQSVLNNSQANFLTSFIDWLWKAQSRFLSPFKCEIGLFWKACHWLRYRLAVKAVNSRPHKDSHWRSVLLCLAFFLLELWLVTSGSSGLEHIVSCCCSVYDGPWTQPCLLVSYLDIVC